MTPKIRFDPGTTTTEKMIFVRLRSEDWDRLGLIADRYGANLKWLVSQIVQSRIKWLYVPEEGEYQRVEKKHRRRRSQITPERESLQALNKLMKDGTAKEP